MPAFKTTPPATDPGLERPELVERLLAAPIAVLAAPGGYGKTSLASQATTAAAGPTAWFTADELDRDRAGVTAQLFSALARAWPDLADSAPAVLDDDAALPLLEATLQTLAGPGCIVLDDVHLLPPEVLDPLARTAVASLPADCHLVLCTRGDAPEVLVRAEAAGTARTLGATELAFTEDECIRLCGSRAPGVEMHARTGGWPLAVALALREPGAGTSTPIRHARVLSDIALAGLEPEPRALAVVLTRIPRFPGQLLVRLGRPYRGLESFAHARGTLFEHGDDGWWSIREWLRDALVTVPADDAIVDAVVAALRDLGEYELASRLLVTEARYEDAIGDVEQLAATGLRSGRSAWVYSLIGEIPAPQQTLMLHLLRSSAAASLHIVGAEADGVSEARLLDLVDRAAQTGPVAELRAQALLADHYRMASDPRMLSVCEAALGDALTVDDPARDLPGRWPREAVPAAVEMLRAYGFALMVAADGDTIARGRRLVATSLDLLDAADHNTLSQRAWSTYMEVLLHLRRAAEAIPLVRVAAYRLAADDHSDAALRMGELVPLYYFAQRYDDARRALEMARDCADRTGNRIALAPLAAIEEVIDAVQHGWDAARGDRFDVAISQLAENPRIAPLAPIITAELAIALVRGGAADAARHYQAQVRAATEGRLLSHTTSLRYRRLEGLLLRADGRTAEGEAVLEGVRAQAVVEGRDALAEVVALDLREGAGEQPVELPASSPPLLVEVLRPELAVSAAGEELPAPRGYPAKLLALLVSTNGTMTIDAAIESLWPGSDPELGRNRLHGVILRLRRRLGLPANGPIRCTEGVVRLEPSPLLEIDGWVFEQHAAVAATRPERRLDAVERYRGDVLSHQFAYDDTVTGYRRRLRRTFAASARELLADPPPGIGRDDLAAIARRAWQAAPDDEALCRVATRTLARLGYPAEARELIAETTKALVDLGIDAEVFAREVAAEIG